MIVEVGSIPGLIRALKNKAPEIKVTDFDLATKVMRFKKIPKLSRKKIAIAMTGMGNDVFFIIPKRFVAQSHSKVNLLIQ